MAFVDLIKIAYFTVFTIACIQFGFNRQILFTNGVNSIKYNKKIINLINIVVISLIFAFFSIICSPKEFVGDRVNYARTFQNISTYDVKTSESIGLFFIESLVSKVSSNPYVFFFIVAFVASFITLLTIRIYPNASPLAVSFLLVTKYFLYSLFLIKHCLAASFIGLSFAFFFDKKYIRALIFIIVATLFHESSIVFIPLLLFLLCGKRKIIRVFEYLLIVSLVILYPLLSSFLISLFNSIPGFEVQLESYVDIFSNIKINNFFTVFKFFPFFYLLVVVNIEKNNLSKVIPNYNQYSMLLVFACIFCFMSCFMYWMWRFAALCYLPIAVFAANIYKKVSKAMKKDIIFLYLIPHLFFTLLEVVQYYALYGGI